MTANAEAIPLMSSMPFSEKIINSVFGKMLIAITQTVLGSVILLLTFLVRQVVGIFVLKYAIILAVGVLAGFSARRFLYENTQILQLLVAWIAAVLSSAALEILSYGFIGINLFTSPNQLPDWQGLIELALMSFSAWMVIAAFQSEPSFESEFTPEPPMPKEPPALQKISNPPRLSLKSRILNIIPSSRNARVDGKLSVLGSGRNGAKKTLKSSLLKLKTKRAKSQELTKISGIRPKSPLTIPRRKNKKIARIKKKRLRKNKHAADVKFVGAQEHSCPYCLELVAANDPRGVMVCSICNTQHHADCWGITGACQIPHAQN